MSEAKVARKIETSGAPGVVGVVGLAGVVDVVWQVLAEELKLWLLEARRKKKTCERKQRIVRKRRSQERRDQRSFEHENHCRIPERMRWLGHKAVVAGAAVAKSRAIKIK